MLTSRNLCNLQSKIFSSAIKKYLSTSCGLCSENSSPIEPGLKQKFLKKLGIFDNSRSELRKNGYMMYESMADKVNYGLFLNDCKMPDTFFSWFTVTELHVWMLMVRAMGAGKDGRFLRNMVVEAMWSDVEHRSKQLAPGSSARREQVTDLGDQFHAALFAYDEGLQSSDTVLASALWRTLFNKQDVSAHALEAAVHLVRKQVQLLDAIDDETFLRKGSKCIVWCNLPIASQR